MDEGYSKRDRTQKTNSN